MTEHARNSVRGEQRFDLFMSYAHGPDSNAVALLQSAIERVATPWYARRKLRVFRDASALAATDDLFHSLQSFIEASRYFLLVASPESAQAEWVRRELRHAQLHAVPILIALTDGTLLWDRATNDFEPSSTAIPPELHGCFQAEPFFVDLRWMRNRARIRASDPRLLQDAAAVAAPILGRNKDDLVSESIRTQRKNMRYAQAAIAVLLGLLALSVYLGYRSETHRRDAEMRAAINEAASADALAGVPGEELRAAVAALRAAHFWLDRADDPPAIAYRALNHAHRSLTTSLPLGPHADSVTQVALSPDTKTALSVDALGTGYLWDVRRGRNLRKTMSGRAARGTFSPNGSKIAWLTREGTVVIEQADTGLALSTLTLPGRQIVIATFSPDGKQVVSLSARNDTDPQLHVHGPAGAVRLARGDIPYWHPAWSKDGQFIAALGSDGSIAIFSATSGARLGRVPQAQGGLVELRKDGARIKARHHVSQTFDSRNWKGSDRQLEDVDPAALPDHVEFAPPDPLQRLYFRRKGDTSWDFGRPSGTVDPELVRGLALSLDPVYGEEAAVASVYMLSNSSLREPLAAHRDAVRYAQWTDTTSLITASDDNTAILWHPQLLSPLQVFRGHTDDVLCATYDPIADRVMTGSADRFARIWNRRIDISAVRVSDKMHRDGSTQSVRSSMQWSNVAFEPDGNHLLAVGQQSSGPVTPVVGRIDCGTGEIRTQPAPHLSPWTGMTDSLAAVRKLDGSTTSDVLHITKLDRTSIFHDLDGGRWIATVGSEDDPRRLAARLEMEFDMIHPVLAPESGLDLTNRWRVSFDQAFMRVANLQGQLKFQVPTTPPCEQYRGSGRGCDLRYGALSPDGRFVADHVGRVWNLRDGTPAFDFRRPSLYSTQQPKGGGTMHPAAYFYGPRTRFSPSGRFLAVMSLDKMAVIYDLKSGDEHTRLVGHGDLSYEPTYFGDGGKADEHDGIVYDVVFSPDEEWVFTRSNDKTVRMFALQTGEHAATLSGQDRGITSVAVSGDLEHLAVAAFDPGADYTGEGAILLYDISLRGMAESLASYAPVRQQCGSSIGCIPASASRGHIR